MSFLRCHFPFCPTGDKNRLKSRGWESAPQFSVSFRVTRKSSDQMQKLWHRVVHWVCPPLLNSPMPYFSTYRALTIVVNSAVNGAEAPCLWPWMVFWAALAQQDNLYLMHVRLFLKPHAQMYRYLESLTPSSNSRATVCVPNAIWLSTESAPELIMLIQ